MTVPNYDQATATARSVLGDAEYLRFYSAVKQLRRSFDWLEGHFTPDLWLTLQERRSMVATALKVDEEWQLVQTYMRWLLTGVPPVWRPGGRVELDPETWAQVSRRNRELATLPEERPALPARERGEPA